MSAHIRSASGSGGWKSISSMFVRTIAGSGGWKNITQGWIRISQGVGGWKRFFSSVISIAQQVTISQSTNSTTFLTTLTGTNYYWSPGPPVLTYKFQRSTNGGTTWSDLDSDFIVNPAFGSSNTKTYSLASSGPTLGVLPNVLNYYRFRVDATYGSLTAESISSSTTIQGPTNVTIGLSSPTFASIQLSWTASTGASRYLVYRSTDNIFFSQYDSVTSTSLSGISDLAGGGTYYFYVVPITGGSFTYPGYLGNNSNTLVLPILATPTLSSATSQSGEFFFTINNYDASNTYVLSTNSGSISRSGSLVTVSGLSSGASATTTVRATRSEYGDSASATRTGSALSQYTISWNANGGSPSSSNTVNSGTNVNAPSKPDRDGYDFLYWTDTPSGSYTYQINEYGSWNVTSNITFYARWSASAPTASGFSRSDSTATPSQPSTLSFSSSNNQVTTSWTNGSPITSVNFAASGAGANTSYTDSSAPFMTSDLSAYSSSGTYTATVTNFNNSLQVRASWNQSNAQSYKVHYSSSVFGSDESAIINNSASSVNHYIGWGSNMGSFTFQAVTLYSGANGSGTSNIFYTGLGVITPAQTSSSRSGSTSLTYQLAKLTTPAGVDATDARTDGVNVTWNAVSGAAYYGVWYGPTPSYDATPDFQNITSTSYLDTSLGSGVTRDYYVQAFRSGNPSATKSDWGGPDSGTRAAPVTCGSCQDYGSSTYTGQTTGCSGTYYTVYNNYSIGQRQTCSDGTYQYCADRTYSTVSSSTQISGLCGYTPVTCGSCEDYGSASYLGQTTGCSGTYYTVYNNYSIGQRKTCSNGTYEYCDDRLYSTVSSSSQINGQCGYVEPPACVCNYSDYGSYHYSPQCCPSGAQRTGSLSGVTSGSCCPNVNKTLRYNCTYYDVNNNASVNFLYCSYVGQCAAQTNANGNRTTCYI